MTRDRLQSLSMGALHEVAASEGIPNYESLQREDLINAVIDALEEDRIERFIENNWTVKAEEKKYDIFRDEELEVYDKDKYIVPEKYNITKIGLIMVNPLMAFVYWEIGDEEKKIIVKYHDKAELFLRVHEVSPVKNGSDFFDISIKNEDNKYYISLSSHGCTYYIDLVFKYPEGEKILCTSNKIDTPQKILRDIEKSENMFRDDFLVLAGVYGFYDDEDSGGMNSHKIVSFLDSGFKRDRK